MDKLYEGSDKFLFEEDVEGFLFYEDKMNDGSDKYILIFEYNSQTLKKLREGDIVAVESYSTLYNEKSKEEKIYTLLEIIRVKPTHLTIERLKKFRFLGAAREFVKEATKDFEEDPRLIRDHIYVEAEAVPTGYVIKKTRFGFEFRRETTKPILGRDVGLLRSPDIIEKLINHNIKDEGIVIGKLYASYEEKQIIDVKIKPYKLVTHHYSVFGFTGHGKSNFNSNLLSKLINHQDLVVIIFDLSDEYTGLLSDVLYNRGYLVIDENDVPEEVISCLTSDDINEDEVYKASVELATKTKRPGIFDDNMFIDTFKNIFEKMIRERRIKLIKDFSIKTPSLIDRNITIHSFFKIIEMNPLLKEEKVKSKYEIFQKSLLRKLKDDELIRDFDDLEIKITEEILPILRSKCDESYPNYPGNVKDIVTSVLDEIEYKLKYEKEDFPDYDRSNYIYIDYNWIKDSFIKNKIDNLCIIVSSDKENICDSIRTIINEALIERRRKSSKSHVVLFVVDEAHEFAINLRESGLSDKEKLSSRIIERLTRMGRKYNLGVCLASQRVAYLNTTTLSNCHTTFIGAIPREYDRTALVGAYSISKETLSQAVTFPPGHWYVVSNGATGMNNVPIRFVAENREKVLAEFFESRGFLTEEGRKKLVEAEYLEGENGA